MRSFFASGLVAVGVGLVVAACAQGDDASGVGDESDAQSGADAAAPCVPSPEICNGKDDNCDGKIDEGFDLDGDGVPTCALGSVPADCDDHDPTIHPGATETCNDKDDNCDGTIDEGFDKDKDGFFQCAHGMLLADCDDTNPLIHPGAAEICDGKDNNCNGKIDDLPGTVTGTLTAPANAHWKAAGSTLITNVNGAVGWAQLTQDVGGQAGALWWNATYTFDVFDMSATFFIQGKQTGADGMAFVWMTGNNVAAVGGGAGYGASGLPGYAVAIDTFQNDGEPAVPYLVVIDETSTTNPVLGRFVIPNVRDGQNHVLRVALASSNKVSVWIDGTSYVSGLAFASPTPLVGQWGFTGGTGGSSEAHWVTGVTMSFPNGQGCVP